MLSKEEIAYYRKRAVDLINQATGLKHSYAYVSDSSFGTQDEAIDTLLRKLYKLPVRPTTGEVYTRIIKPPTPTDLVEIPKTGARPVDRMTYLWQLNNPVSPYGTCNVTCGAMCLSGYGIKGSRGIAYLPEELRYQVEEVNNGDRHVPDDLVKAFNQKGGNCEFRDTWTMTQLIDHLDTGNPVIFDGWYSPSGHFIVALSYDRTKKRFLVWDPYGEWYNTGYQVVNETTGKNVQYSLNMMMCAGISASGWVDSHSLGNDPINSPTYAAIVFYDKQPVTVKKSEPIEEKIHFPTKFINHLKEFEGCELNSYQDDVGVWTIGYGCTTYMSGKPVREGEFISQLTAEQELDHDLQYFWKSLAKTTPHWDKLTSNQQLALLSFTFNTGWSYGTDGFDTLNRCFKDQDLASVPYAFRLYVNPGTEGEVGLRRRREAEIAMWNS